MVSVLFVVRPARATARWYKTTARSAVGGEPPARFLKIPCMSYVSRDTKKERHKTAAPLKSGLAFGKIAAMELPAHDLAAAHTVRMDSWVYVRQYCAKIDEAALNRMKLIVRSLAEQNGVIEKLKAENQMEWVRQMNACKAQAEEIVKAELIYN